MLDHQSLEAVTDLNQALSERGITLAVVPDTPLSLLVRCVPVMDDSSTNDHASLIPKIVDLSRSEEHAELMASVVKTASESVRWTLDYARNTVMPHIRRVIDAYKQRVAANLVPMNPFNISVKYLPEIYKISVGREYLYQFENTPAASAPDSVNLGNYTADEILSLVRLSDDGGFNESAHELLTADNGAGVQAIIAVLNGAASVNRLDPFFSLPMAIVLNNISSPKAGVGMNLSQYNATRTIMTTAAAKNALRMIAYLDDCIKNNILYSTLVQRDGKTIELNGEVYRAMLDKGLTADMLIGNELMGRKFRGVQLTTPEAQSEMLATYERDRAQRQSAHALNVRELSRQAVLDVLRADHKQVVTDGAYTVEGDNEGRSWQRLKEFVDRAYKGLYREAEAEMMISAAICGCWYLHTDAWRVIDIMMTIEREHPNLPSKEVATMATIRYISEWVGCMIGATANPGE